MIDCVPRATNRDGMTGYLHFTTTGATNENVNPLSRTIKIMNADDCPHCGTNLDQGDNIENGKCTFCGALLSSSCSASELLRSEAERLGGIRTRKPIESDLRWAYSVAAAFLDCKSDPAMIHRWQEIPRQNE